MISKSEKEMIAGILGLMVVVAFILGLIVVFWGGIVMVLVTCGTFAFNIATSISEYLLN